MKTAIFIPAIGKGGAERVVYSLIKRINFDSIIVFDDREIAYQIPKDKIISLNSPASQNLSRKLFNFFPRFMRLRRLKKDRKINICLSLLEPANLFNIITKGDDKVIISFHSHYTYTFERDPFLGRGFTRKILVFIYKFLIKYLYNRADLMVAVSQETRQDLIRNFGVDPEKIIVIYNPLDREEISRKISEPLEIYEAVFTHPVIITAGRLTKQKGQWYLIRIFKELKKSFPELRLVILGEGELKDYLVSLSEDLGLKTYVWDRDSLSEEFDVYFLGFQKNPFKFVAKSTIFVFTSLYEGFGNVLVEAMACGVPVVSSDCRSGPREILAPNTDFEYQTTEPEYAEYGVLMPVFDGKYKNANEPLDKVERMWVETLKDLLQREDLRELYAKKAWQRAMDFDIEKISKEWESILK